MMDKFSLINLPPNKCLSEKFDVFDISTSELMPLENRLLTKCLPMNPDAPVIITYSEFKPSFHCLYIFYIYGNALLLIWFLILKSSCSLSNTFKIFNMVQNSNFKVSIFN